VRVFGAREAGLLVLLAALMLYAWRVDPAFIGLRAQSYLAPHIWELAIVALPMLLIVVSGGIDLSVGSMVALSAVVLGLLFEWGINPITAAAVAVLTGTALGALNGAFISKLKVHPLIVTLATLAAFRGVAEGISLARPLSGYPEVFLKTLGGWTPGIVFAALAILAGLVLTQCYFGRWVFAIGVKERAAEFSRIPVGKVKFLLYAFCGFCSGIAAVILVARNNTAKADIATGMELDVITAVVLGGASIDGGEGSIVGLLLGIILIHETREFVTWHWKQDELNLIVIGGLLIASVILQKLFQRKSRVVSKAT
jgi:rhamnose transport system permease protein